MTSLQNLLFDKLKSLAKLVVNNEIHVPSFSNETRTDLEAQVNDNIRFELIINRKGHRNKNIFSLVFLSPRYDNKIMTRLDYSGTSHKGVETPHVHIYDEKHDFGKNALPLSALSADDIKTYMDALDWFLNDNNVVHDNVKISENLT
ncbi:MULTISPECIES: hypothetical protein [unclassified Leuconostoc]|uniref:DUF6978 family protein n=1 Tax=unclassified Leuconostoc TaxID=2685106 RepID=UPI0019076CE5|nr:MULTISPECIES: hypothetical protein [unclassified Leuconostoc]MBK0040790.1 hypothetical protein [Leuconostoc sp. S51]MBK0051788.1 hypothetical protein [Leuconostoc sp. S50]